MWFTDRNHQRIENGFPFLGFRTLAKIDYLYPAAGHSTKNVWYIKKVFVISEDICSNGHLEDRLVYFNSVLMMGPR